MKTRIINERTRSVVFQLARDFALSAATVVEYVNPFNCISDGLAVRRLTMIKRHTEKTKRRIQKYRKLMSCKSIKESTKMTPDEFKKDTKKADDESDNHRG